MKRTTTANNSRRPVCAIALGLTLAAANLMAARLTEYSFEAYDSLIEARVSAISQKKNLFVLSGAPWCTYCNQTKTYIASLGADFNSKFVVYYADVSKGAEMSGRLPQYGTFDPRTIDTTYGWSASANSYLDSSGYSPGMIDRCISEANRHSVGTITALRLEGMEAVFPDSSAALVAKADFSDGKTMVFPASSITWSATGSASVGSDGVLAVNSDAAVGNAIAVTAKFPSGIAVGTSDSATKEMSVVSTTSVKSIDVDISEVNLADSTDVRFKCIATFENGKKGEIPASSWSVSFARTLPYPDGTPLSALQTPRPVIDATGNLVYSTDVYYDNTYNQWVNGPGYSIGNHVLNVTANWGNFSHTKEVTVWGPSRAWISDMTLLTPAGALAPGEVIRLRCPRFSYTYGDKVVVTDDSELFEFQALVNVDLGNSTVPATGDDHLVQRFGKMFIALSPDLDIGRDNTLDVKVYCRRKGSAYTGTDYDAALNSKVLGGKLSVARKVTASDSVAAAIAAAPQYANVNATWIAKYFPDATITEDFLNLDSDGDGYSNGAEFTLGTDPTNKVSRFAYTAVHFDAHKLYYRLMWDELPGRTWKLQGKKTPFDAEWTDLERGEGCDETAAAEYHYFRVEADGAVHTHAMQDETLWTPPSWYTFDEGSNTVTIEHDSGTDTYNPQIAVPDIEPRRQLYKVCTEAQRQIYHLYVWAWENKDLYYGGYKTYKLKIPLSPSDAQEAYNAFINDYPEAWAVTLSYSFDQHQVKGSNWVVGVTITISKYDYDEKLTTFNAALDGWRSSLSAKIAAATSEEARMKVVFDAAKSWQYGGTVHYDYDSGLATGISPAHTVYGGVVNKLTVCEGFAKTFAYLCHELGASDNVAVLCGKVGTSGSTHVWNAVLVDGQWQEVDPTAGEWTDAFKTSVYQSHEATGVSALWLERAKAGEYGGTAEEDPVGPEPDPKPEPDPDPEPDPEPEPSNPDSAYTGTFFVPGVDANTVSYDCNKSSGDSNMCWAYAFACMVAWYQDLLESTGVEISSKELRNPASIVNSLKYSSGNYSGSFSRGVSYYIDDGYMLSYIDTTAWNPMRPTAYAGYDRTNLASTFSSLTEFSSLLLANLYKGVAFADLYLPDSVGGHAVAIWGAEFDGGIVKAVYISDSDDGKNGFVKYPVVCESGWIRLSGHWAPRVHALTFLWAPAGVELTVPVNPVVTTSALLKSCDGRSVTVRIPHSSEWMKSYMKRHPDDYAARLEQDSDGDGFTDVAEYVAGTDPADKAKYLRITAFKFGSDGRPEVVYEPQSNEGVGVFTVEGAPSPAGPWKTHEDADTAHRFFRVIVTPK